MSSPPAVRCDGARMSRATAVSFFMASFAEPQSASYRVLARTAKLMRWRVFARGASGPGGFPSYFQVPSVVWALTDDSPIWVVLYTGDSSEPAPPAPATTSPPTTTPQTSSTSAQTTSALPTSTSTSAPTTTAWYLIGALDAVGPTGAVATARDNGAPPAFYAALPDDSDGGC